MCTAFYMTRLMAMTFWGEERFRDHAHSMDHEGHAQKKEHRTPHHDAHVPHESPKSMVIPLVVLAVLATIGGFVGISTAFTGGKHVGGRLNIVNWMKPIIWEPPGHESEHGGSQVPAHTELVAATAEETSSAFPQTGFNLAHAIESRLGSEIATEWLFIIISLAVAGIGIGLGLLFYVKDTRLPDIWAARLRPLYLA